MVTTLFIPHISYINKSTLFKFSRMIRKRNLKVAKSDKGIIRHVDLLSGAFINLPVVVCQPEHISLNSLAEILMEIHKIKICPDDDDKHVGSFKCGRAI